MLDCGLHSCLGGALAFGALLGVQKPAACFARTMCRRGHHAVTEPCSPRTQDALVDLLVPQEIGSRTLGEGPCKALITALVLFFWLALALLPRLQVVTSRRRCTSFPRIVYARYGSFARLSRPSKRLMRTKSTAYAPA